MNMSGGEQQSTPTDPKERENLLSISEVPSELVRYLIEDFKEGYESIVQENPEWSIEHYLEEDKTEDWQDDTKELEIISLYSFKQNINYQTVSEKGHEDIRAIRVIKRENYSTKITVIEILSKIDDNWTKLSSDQSPNDQQP